MNGVVEIQIWQFLLVYLLLIIVLAIMKKCKTGQSQLLFVASLRMTIQLIIAGLILTYVFENPHPVFTIGYIVIMEAFAIHRVLSKNRDLNRKFKIAIGLCLGLSGSLIILFFICVIVGESIFNPQYVIPISGMVVGNAMTGVALGLKAFKETMLAQRDRVETLINMGVPPKKILLPFVNQGLETALLPTLNSMVGMGVVSLPGMMTGQILSGTLPTTAILYQIAIMVSICTVVCVSVFGSLYMGYKTLYNSRNQVEF